MAEPQLLSSSQSTSLDFRLQTYRNILREATLSAESFESALASAVLYAELCYYNQDGFLSDEVLEAALFNKYQHLIASSEPSFLNKHQTRVLHVVTETYDSGGHSRLLESILQIQNTQGEPTAVFISRSGSPMFEKRCRALNTEIIKAKGTLHERCLALIRKGSDFAHIFLHIHPFDIGMSLAARYLRACGKKVYFVNHADERFSFGSGAADVVCEISGFGWRLTENSRAHNSQHFLGIPISKLGVWSKGYSTTRKMVLSVGQSHKFNPDKSHSFPDMVTNVISRTGCSFTIVGSNGKEPWWQAARKKHPDRLHFIQAVAHEDLKKIITTASCYVDSFPIIGGTAFAEMVYTGIPSFGVSNVPIGYSVADSIRSESVELMEEALISYLLYGELHYSLNTLVSAVGEAASFKAAARRFNAAVSGKYESPPREMIKSGSKASLTFYRDRWLQAGKINLPLPQTSIPRFGVRLKYIAAALRARDLRTANYINAMVFLLRRAPSS
jgi:hypothetical protein